MQKYFVATFLLLTLMACPGGNPPPGGTGGTTGGNTGTGGTSAGFNIVTLDANAKETGYLAMAYDPVQEKIGVAYYTPAGTQTVMNVNDYNLNFVEYSQGNVSTPVTLRKMQRSVGLAMARNPTNGDFSVAYLGGSSSFVMGQSMLWFQNDAALMTRTGSTWGAERTIARNGDDTVCGNGPSDRGFLVGVWPAIVFDSTGKLYYGWRDVHDGQFPQQDWNASDAEVAEIVGAGAPTYKCVNPGGNGGASDGKPSWGAHMQLAMGAGNQPFIVYDRGVGGVDTAGQEGYFQQRNANGTWSFAANVAPFPSDTQTGLSPAYQAQEGYGIAVVDGSTSKLKYLRSDDGLIWDAPAEVFGLGSGGWYPSLAMDPLHNGEPSIAYYVCSPRGGVAPTNCLENEDELRVKQRIGAPTLGNWIETVVDTEGGYAPKIGFFASGKRFIVYRHPKTGVVKLALEK